ncbi:MAG: hypothetical protein ACK4KW_08810 [Gemmobacter sp.]
MHYATTGAWSPPAPAIPRIARIQLVMAVLWLMVGLLIGIVMAASGDFTLRSVHTHVQLLGWVSLCLTGLVYAVLPDVAATASARWHVALHNLGLPVMCASLAAYQLGSAAAEPFIALGSMLALAGLGFFTAAVLRAIR